MAPVHTKTRSSSMQQRFGEAREAYDASSRRSVRASTARRTTRNDAVRTTIVKPFFQCTPLCLQRPRHTCTFLHTAIRSNTLLCTELKTETCLRLRFFIVVFTSDAMRRCTQTLLFPSREMNGKKCGRVGLAGCVAIAIGRKLTTRRTLSVWLHVEFLP